MGNCVDYYFCCDLNKQWFMGHLEAQQERVERLARQVDLQHAFVTTLQAQSLHAQEHIVELKSEHATMHAQSEQLEAELKTRCANSEAELQLQREHAQGELQATVDHCEEAIRSKQAELGAQTSEVESKLKDLLVAQQQQLDRQKDQLKQLERSFEEQQVAINQSVQEELTHRFKQVIECLIKRFEERCELSKAILGVGRSETMPSGPRGQRAFGLHAHQSLRQRWLASANKPIIKAINRAINNAATSSFDDSNQNPEDAAETAGGVAAESDIMVNKAGGTGENDKDELWAEMVTRLSDAIFSRLRAQERIQHDLEIRIYDLKTKFSNFHRPIMLQSRMPSETPSTISSQDSGDHLEPSSFPRIAISSASRRQRPPRRAFSLRTPYLPQVDEGSPGNGYRPEAQQNTGGINLQVHRPESNIDGSVHHEPITTRTTIANQPTDSDQMHRMSHRVPLTGHPPTPTSLTGARNDSGSGSVAAGGELF